MPQNQVHRHLIQLLVRILRVCASARGLKVFELVPVHHAARMTPVNPSQMLALIYELK